jgi:hypothetical protein
VKTSQEIGMFYFPGWDSDAKWDCVRRVAPIRKPLLGYYDEANPECVDWQIKWAVENGIGVFLVDWYWLKGQQILNHWFDAYQNAKYRDSLKVSIMWANHNPQGSHSIEDWRTVTQHWIDHYFNLPAYYRMNDTPVVFLWDPSLIRNDLGGIEAVKSAFDESQAMARKAGYKGIIFVAMANHESPSQAEVLLKEGYSFATNYHEWGGGMDGSLSMKEERYADVVRTAPSAWDKRNQECANLSYLPIVDTGWDARPWHGDKSLVIAGRTSALFENLLQSAKAFLEKHPKPLLVLGPANEWGEGSYIEPANEYGFEMYEAIRKVFTVGPPAEFPANLSPQDCGLGPYDFKLEPLTTYWTFEQDPGNWATMMNVTDFRVQDGALRFKTTTSDGAIYIGMRGLKASEYGQVCFTMQLKGNLPSGSSGQFFWSTGGVAMTEATCVTFPLITDGKAHEYQLNLSKRPRWRGRISTLRFDPCDVANTEVIIDDFRFGQ